jgi:hypothetical protein
MVPILFLLISRQFPVLAVAERLTRARFGFWSADRRTFFPGFGGGKGSASVYGGVCILNECRILEVSISPSLAHSSTPSDLKSLGPRRGSVRADTSWMTASCFLWTRVALLFSKLRHHRMAWLGRSLIGIGVSVTVWRGSWRLLSMDILCRKDGSTIAANFGLKRHFSTFPTFPDF